MITETEQAEYLEEIRQHVCSRCVERPPGGPPCEALGKVCGVELHLPQLIESVHQVHSPLMRPYLEQNRNTICSACEFLHMSVCPCPMDSLAMLVVEAIETVDQRWQETRNSVVRVLTQGSRRSLARQRAEEGRDLAKGQKDKSVEDLEAVCRAYEKGVGTWTGCDWPTSVGKSGLDLNGWTAAEADGMYMETMDTTQKEDWRVAARWLAVIERRAHEAEKKAAAAVEAAGAARWEEALHNAELAASLEFSTGRVLRHGFPVAWQSLREEIEAGYIAHKLKEE